MFIHICIDLWKHRSRASLNCIQCPTKAAKMVAAGCRALHRLSTLLFLNDHLDRLLYLSILMSATLRLYYSAADCVKEAETMPLTRAKASSTILFGASASFSSYVTLPVSSIYLGGGEEAKELTCGPMYRHPTVSPSGRYPSHVQ